MPREFLQRRNDRKKDMQSANILQIHKLCEHMHAKQILKNGASFKKSCNSLHIWCIIIIVTALHGKKLINFLKSNKKAPFHDPRMLTACSLLSSLA